MKLGLNFLIYTVITIGIVSFAFYQYKKSQKEEVKQEQQSLLFSGLTVDQVRSISIEQDQYKLKLQRQDKKWKLVSPMEDMANSEEVEKWVQKILSEKKKDLSSKEGIDWEEYDLDQNTKTLEIKSLDDKVFQLAISHQTSFDGRFYIKKKDSLLLGSATWADLTNKTEKDFRNYKIFKLKKAPKLISYKSSELNWEFTWDNFKWSLDNNLFPVSYSAIEDYWKALSSISLDQETQADTETARKKFKLLDPKIEIRVKNSEGEQAWVKISPLIEDKFYVLLSDRDYIFTLPKEQEGKLLLTETKVRDHFYPFQFKKAKAYFAQLKGYGLDLKLKKEKEEWLLIKNNQKEMKTSSPLSLDLDKNKWQDSLNQISKLSAKKYLPKRDFENQASIMIKDQEQKILLDLSFSAFLEEEKNKIVYVKSNLAKDIMILDFKDVEAIFSSDILKKPKESKEDTQK